LAIAADHEGAGVGFAIRDRVAVPSVVVPGTKSRNSVN
jgi:hypothetical protein